MKKITLLILAAVLFSPSATPAQFVTGLGLKGGVTLSDQLYSYSPDFNNKHKLKLGFNGSVFAEFLNNRYINILAEAGYDQRGFILLTDRVDEFGNYIGESRWKYGTDYAFTSVGAKLKYKNKAVTPYFLLMPRIDFYLGYKVDVPDDFIFVEKEFKDPVLEDFKKVMFGVGIGAGIEFNRLLPFKVFAEADYNPGIINSFGNSFVKVKEYSFNFKIGINFIKEKKGKK